MIELVIEALWFILPAYVANSIAIDVSGFPILKNYSAPIDGGRKWRGKRILGDGKTWRGLICGTIAGGATGYLLEHLSCTSLQFFAQYSLSPHLPHVYPLLGLVLGFGALMGDVFASFLKRRMNLGRGAHLPIIDQLDYVVMAFIFASVLVPVNLTYFAIVAVITVPIHYIANFVAYAIKLKKVPW